MTAREKFRIGDRVKLSAEGLSFGLNPRSREKLGTVVGFGIRRGSPAVGVRLDGSKRPRSYHADFWEMV